LNLADAVQKGVGFVVMAARRFGGDSSKGKRETSVVHPTWLSMPLLKAPRHQFVRAAMALAVGGIVT
jgi:hypothetical protein